MLMKADRVQLGREGLTQLPGSASPAAEVETHCLSLADGHHVTEARVPAVKLTNITRKPLK